jgi:hypothetical protein
VVIVTQRERLLKKNQIDGAFYFAIQTTRRGRNPGGGRDLPDDIFECRVG